MTAQERKCPFCEQVVVDDMRVCHYCGRELPTHEAGANEGGARAFWNTGRTFLIVVVVALVVLALVLALRSWLARPIALPIVTLLSALYPAI